MRSGSTGAAAALSMVLMLVMATAVPAQQNAVEDAEAIEVTTEVLERLVTVYPVVIAIAEDAEPRMQNAETPAVAEAIRELAEDRILAVLAEARFTAKQYMAVVAKLNEDDELRQQFSRMLAAEWGVADAGS